MSRLPRSRRSKNEPSGVTPLHAPCVPAATKSTGKAFTLPLFTTNRIKAELDARVYCNKCIDRHATNWGTPHPMQAPLSILAW